MTAKQDSTLHIRFKKLRKDAVTPQTSTSGSAGFDLTAVSKTVDPETQCTIFGTGLAFEIPAGHVGLLFPRSSVYKKAHALTNSVGVLDSDYRGEVKAIFRNLKIGGEYQIGERVCQLVVLPIPKVTLEEATELSDTTRGVGGFGSTGS